MLLLNNLRSRIVVETDGQLKTGRDVVIGGAARGRGVRLRHGAARGARLHHDARLPPEHLPGRRRHAGPAAARRSSPAIPTHVVNFMRFIAQEVRELMAAARLPHASRRWSAAPTASRLKPARRALEGAAASTSRPIFHQPDVGAGRRPLLPDRPGPRPRGVARQDDAPRAVPARRSSAARGSSATLPIRNRNRVVGTILGSELTRRHGAAGPARRHDPAHFQGSAGQSFGAFVPPRHHPDPRRRRQRLRRQGALGRKHRRLPAARLDASCAEENIIIGNVALYGATARRGLHPRRGRRALRGPQQRRRTRWSRRWATTAAST